MRFNKKAEHEELRRHEEQLMREKDFLSADNDRKQQLIKSLHQELDGDDDDPLLHRLRCECEKRIKNCESV